MSKQEGFCMVGGTGVTSYANNSLLQKNIIAEIKLLLEESIRAVCNGSSEYLAIADLGCSSGPNALAVLQHIINVILVKVAQSPGIFSVTPELNVFLNDLPHNDFNAIFETLPSFRREIEQESGVGIKCYISATPGSFYGRILPRNSLHFVYSITCLHWLSQAPKGLTKAMNDGCIYGRKGSPREVLEAYRQQFSDDFTKFLRCRSEEIVHGGRIVLSFLVTQDDETCSLMELTSIALYKLASQGKIDKKKLDKFNLQLYRPTVEQVKQLIESEGSFALDKLHTFTLSWVKTIRADRVKNGEDKDVYQLTLNTAKAITKSIRAIVESLLANEFGEEMMDQVFHLVEEMVINNIATGEDMEILNLAVSLTRKVSKMLHQR